MSKVSGERKSSTTRPFGVYDFRCQVLKGNIWLRNKQIWLPPSDNYITHVLLQSDTAGHYRAIGDLCAQPEKNFQTAGISRRFISKKKYLKCKVSAPSCFLSLAFKVAEHSFRARSC